MGVGFLKWPHGDPHVNPPYDYMVSTGARFIRGNHDNPYVCKRHTQWIADGTMEGDIMFCGGAYSIDKDYRNEGFDWWPEEEISHQDMLVVYDIYTQNKPRLMVTHDCPAVVLDYILSHHWRVTTRTGQFFDRLFEEHQPETWVFGHHHKSFEMSINGTKFICLNELESRWID